MSAVAHSKVSDERVRAIPTWRFLLGRPELGAAAGTVLVFAFFLTFAGDSGMPIQKK